jgi:hypothetical protein
MPVRSCLSCMWPHERNDGDDADGDSSSRGASAQSPRGGADRGVRASSSGAEEEKESAGLVDAAAKENVVLPGEFATLPHGDGGDGGREDDRATAATAAAGLVVDPARCFAGYQNPDAAAELYRDHLRFHQDTLIVDAFETRRLSADTATASDQASEIVNVPRPHTRDRSVHPHHHRPPRPTPPPPPPPAYIRTP